MTDRELDAAVAEKIMGWDLEATRQLEKDIERAGNEAGDGSSAVWCEMIPHYSTDISAAWEIAPKFPLGFYVRLIRDTKLWEAMLVVRGKEPNEDALFWAQAKGKTAPRAICLAALKAVGE